APVQGADLAEGIASFGVLEGEHAAIQRKHRQANAPLEHEVNVIGRITPRENQLLGCKRGRNHLSGDQLAVPLGQGFEQDRAAEHGRNGTMSAHEGLNVAKDPKTKSNWRRLAQASTARPLSAPKRSSKTRAMTMVARRRS